MTMSQDQRVAALYRDGKTHSEIADAVAITVKRSQQIVRRLRRRGVDLGPPRGTNPTGTGAPPSPFEARVIELYHAGYLAPEIAKEIGETTRRVKTLTRQLLKDGALRIKLAEQNRVIRRGPPKRASQPGRASRSGPPIDEPDPSKMAIMPEERQDTLYAAEDYSGHDIVEGPVNLRYLPPPPPMFSLLRSQMG